MTSVETVEKNPDITMASVEKPVNLPASESKPEEEEQGQTTQMASSGGEVKVKRKCGRPRNPIPRHKRSSHIMAEHKRRGKIQSCFHTLRAMVPRYVFTSNRNSKSNILTDAVDHCRFLQGEVRLLDETLHALRQEKAALTSEVEQKSKTSNCESTATGSRDLLPRDESTSLDELYQQYVCQQPPNSGWTSSEVMLRVSGRLFESYKHSVAGQMNFAGLVNSVTHWAVSVLGGGFLAEVCRDSLDSSHHHHHRESPVDLANSPLPPLLHVDTLTPHPQDARHPAPWCVGESRGLPLTSPATEHASQNVKITISSQPRRFFDHTGQSPAVISRRPGSDDTLLRMRESVRPYPAPGPRPASCCGHFTNHRTQEVVNVMGISQPGIGQAPIPRYAPAMQASSWQRADASSTGSNFNVSSARSDMDYRFFRSQPHAAPPTPENGRYIPAAFPDLHTQPHVKSPSSFQHSPRTRGNQTHAGLAPKDLQRCSNTYTHQGHGHLQHSDQERWRGRYSQVSRGHVMSYREHPYRQIAHATQGRQSPSQPGPPPPLVQTFPGQPSLSLTVTTITPPQPIQAAPASLENHVSSSAHRPSKQKSPQVSLLQSLLSKCGDSQKAAVELPSHISLYTAREGEGSYIERTLSASSQNFCSFDWLEYEPSAGDMDSSRDDDVMESAWSQEAPYCKRGPCGPFETCVSQDGVSPRVRYDDTRAQHESMRSGQDARYGDVSNSYTHSHTQAAYSHSSTQCYKDTQQHQPSTHPSAFCSQQQPYISYSSSYPCSPPLAHHPILPTVSEIPLADMPPFPPATPALDLTTSGGRLNSSPLENDVKHLKVMFSEKHRCDAISAASKVAVVGKMKEHVRYFPTPFPSSSPSTPSLQQGKRAGSIISV